MQVNETILIIYFLVAINFLFNRLKDFSCHTQTWLNDNLYAKHLFNIAAIFFVIVLFTRSNPIHPIAIIFLTLAMYMFFMIVTKCDYRFLSMFVASMVIVFFIEAYKSYYKKLDKDTNTEDPQRQKVLIISQLTIQIISFIIIFIGFFVYVGQKSREYPNWRWSKFFIGVHKCKGNALSKHLQRGVGKDLKAGIKKVFA